VVGAILSFPSGVLLGYVAKISGSYDRPLFLMVAVLSRQRHSNETRSTDDAMIQ